MKLCRMIWRVVALSAVAAAFLRVEPAPALAEGNPKNGLSSQAFRANVLTTNREALKYLVTYSLRDLFSDSDEAGDSEAKKSARQHVRDLLHDPAARAVAEELVRCALNERITLDYTDSHDAASPRKYSWTGELGLCPAWREGAPDLMCQQLVTACLMARVNALNVAVPISMRGKPPIPRPRGVVPAEMTFRESLLPQHLNKGTPIPTRGWNVAHVGTCTRGERVSLALDGASTDGSLALRICAGIHGCESGPSPSWVPRGISPLRYEHLGDFSSAIPASAMGPYEFSCPTDLLSGGYYSVMIKNGDAHDIRRTDGSGASPAAGVYPAAEQQVFGFLEGAFFGNLFDWRKLIEPQQNPGGLPYEDVHACYSFGNQELGVAYLNSRICALPEGRCFLHPPQPCQAIDMREDRCRWSADEGAYRACLGSAGEPFEPITTYLNGPCDLIGEGALCDKIRALPRSIPIERQPGPLKPPETRGCVRSCSTGDSNQLATSLTLVGLVAWRLGRRRRRRAG